MKILDNVTYIDLETTGLDPRDSRIIEIGLVKVVNGKVEHKFTQLINPEEEIPELITNITGIEHKDVMDAPTFAEIKGDLLELLDGSLFVAHNVSFDYGFISKEFKQTGIEFHSDRLCTVQFSKLATPEISRHNLSALAEHFHIPIPNRHRAYDDAYALYELMKIYRSKLPIEVFEMYMGRVLKKVKKRHLKQENPIRLL